MNSCCAPPPSDPKESCCGSAGAGRMDRVFWICAGLVAILYVFHLGPHSDLPEWVQTMAHTAFAMVNTMWWGVLIGFFFVCAMAKVPRPFIMALFGRGGTTSGLLRATAAGVLLDLCSHGILMIGARLYERGASAGQVIAFLIASPWNSFSLTLVLISLIGLPWTVVFIFLSMLIALATGWLFDRLVDRGVLPANPNALAHDALEDFDWTNEARTALSNTRFDRAFVVDMLRNGLSDARMVVKWLLFGILLAGLLRAFVSVEDFVQFFGPSTLGLIVTMIAATVIEVCSEGSTPIAADIVTRAQAPGNGFAFLMTGVSTDYTEIMVLKSATKSWKLAFALPLLTTPQIFLVAWLMNLAA